MGIDDVDVVELQPFQGREGAFDDMLAGEAMVVDFDFSMVSAEVDLSAVSRMLSHLLHTETRPLC